MDDFSPSDLKTILHSKRANLYYLQHCRVLVNGGRVEYVTNEGSQSRYWNIPIANTTSLLLGTGTSITQAAMRELAKAGVLVGFCGGGGTPLFAANEVDVDVAWLTPQSEYRPTEYLQYWVHFWFDDVKRLDAARAFQLARLARIEAQWTSRAMKDAGFSISIDQLHSALAHHREAIGKAPSTVDLLTLEARLTKMLFKLAVNAVANSQNVRCRPGSSDWQGTQ
jgi:CRISPR-associated protein Cas1